MDIVGIPPERIVIYGQSLGTAVSIAVAEHFSIQRSTDFRAIVLVAPFSDLPTLVLHYAIGGVVPILSPLRPYPALQKFFASKIRETWFSATRLMNLVKQSKRLNLCLIHAKDDYEIPWTHSKELFLAAANATSEEGMSMGQIDAVKMHRQLGEDEWVDTWKAGQKDGGVKYIQKHIVPGGGRLPPFSRPVFVADFDYEGHNRVTTYPAVAKVVLDAFKDP